MLKPDFSAVFALFLPIFQTAPFIKPLLNEFFISSSGGRVKTPPLEFVGQILLGNIRIFIIMSIFVIFAVTQLFHQVGGCIADSKRNRQRTCILNTRFNFCVGFIYAVALGSRGKINSGLGQGQFAFGVP